MNWKQAKKCIHDISGCDNPDYWNFEKIKGVYLPANIKEFKAVWEPPYYETKIEFVGPSFFFTAKGYNQEEMDKALNLETGHFVYLGYGHFIIRLK